MKTIVPFYAPKARTVAVAGDLPWDRPVRFFETPGGPADIAYQNCINTRKVLQELGLSFDYRENAQAGHSWTTWRADLETLAPTLFR